MIASRSFLKSPLNYIGGKYKLLPQIIPLFPDNVKTFVDLFAGGGDVFINVEADKIIANDINNYLIDIYRAFQQSDVEEIVTQIETTIAQWNLSATNEESYKSFRDYYNQTHTPIDLFILICYSYNHQFRFNANHQFNNPFGRNRSWFNPTLRRNLIRFIRQIKDIEFHATNFKLLDLSFLKADDFVYADPPYLITTGSYNDGKRGFEGWTWKEETWLYDKLDDLNKNNVKFALSNVMSHKGKTNLILEEWSKKYNVNLLEKDYRNSSYHSKDNDTVTREVLITNY